MTGPPDARPPASLRSPAISPAPDGPLVLPWSPGAQATSVVQVFWARPTQADPALHDLLDEVEQTRFAAFLRAEDRARFLLGASVVRRVVGHWQDIPADAVRLDRTCPDCGRPHGKVRADGMELSVTHSGDLIGVAFRPALPLGLDVELADRRLDPDGLATMVLSGPESAELNRFPAAERVRAFTTYWTRKEAVVKATGDGLRADVRGLTVSAPDQPAAVTSWADRPGPVRLTDLDVGTDHSAALAVLTADPVTVVSQAVGAWLTDG